MDITDSQNLQKLPLLKPLTRNSSSSLADPEIEDDEHHYISLKDLTWSSSSSILPCRSSILNQEGNNEFDSSKIVIRNPLVKSAASAYLQSTAILAIRDENCLLSLWGKLNGNIETSCSCCNVYFRDPLEACLRPIHQFLVHIVGVLGRGFSHIKTFFG
ncbi:hypothetical protein PTKIN_Ptkin01aG0084800 [Pterospermum kingtungense]